MTSQEKVLSVYPGAYEDAHGNGIWWSNERSELVMIGKSWDSIAAKLPSAPIPGARDLDGFIDETVERVCPAPLVVSETAVRQLRPLFAEHLELRVALEDIVVASEQREPAEQSVTKLAECIARGRVLLRR